MTRSSTWATSVRKLLPEDKLFELPCSPSRGRWAWLCVRRCVYILHNTMIRRWFLPLFFSIFSKSPLTYMLNQDLPLVKQYRRWFLLKLSPAFHIYASLALPWPLGRDRVLLSNNGCAFKCLISAFRMHLALQINRHST